MTERDEQRYDAVVLGGGWAGLSAAREILRHRPQFSVLVLEREPESQSGGLLRSETIDGFTFDVGGPHLLFSRYPETLSEVKEVLEGNFIELPRRSFVLFEDTFVPYPFENGLFTLRPETRARLGRGVIEAMLQRGGSPQWVPKDFRDWIYGLFGDAIAREYLEPYNLKVWKRPLEELSADWVHTPGRLPLPSLSALIQSIAGMETIGYQEQSKFFYPRSGGIESLYRAALSGVRKRGVEVRFESPVRSIQRRDDCWWVNRTLSTDTIVNTLPLPEAMDMIRLLPNTSTLIPTFDYNQVVVVGIALDQPTPDQTAVYVPRSDVVFHRYTWMSYMNRVGDGRSNLIAEVTVPKDVRCDITSLQREVVQGLLQLGIVQTRESIRFVRAWLNTYGYPVYHKDTTAVSRQVLDALGAHGFHSVGRWGSWEYWNTDMVLRAVQATIPRALGATTRD